MNATRRNRVDQPVPEADAHWTGARPGSPWVDIAHKVAVDLGPESELHDRDGSFVAPAFDRLRDEGLLSMLVPEDLGGGGASFAEACAVLTELARGCPATSLTLSMHTHLVAAQVWRHRHGLPAPVLSNIAANQPVLVSTGASDWLDSSGRAIRVDGGFRVSARKAPASGSPIGDVLVTSVRWDDSPDGAKVLHASIPFTAESVSIEATWDTMGMRATGSDTVVLDDVFVPADAVALERGEWHPVWGTVVGAAMPLIMSTYVGVAEEAAARATVLAARRSDPGGVAPLIGRMHNRLVAARDAVRAMIEAAADLRFDSSPAQASLTLARRTNAADAAIDTVRLALEVGGGAAYARAGGIERLFRDVHGALYHPLPAHRQEGFSGRLALGLDPVG